ncbi:MAG TPA: hypothetical protein EYP19_11850 [Desulfobacterales bacterium]|nr:hypothetical protein [Desulfobacterales bacterium]
MKILPLREITNEEMARLSIVIELINRYGAFAAKVSSGYGVVSIQADFSPQTLDQLGSAISPRGNKMPDLRDFFFARYEFDEPKDENWWKQIFGVRQAVAGKLDNGSSPRPLRRAANELEHTFREGLLLIAPAIRNWLRYSWQAGLTSCQEYYVFGEAQSVCPACCKPGFRQDRRNTGQFWCPNCRTSFKKGNERPAMASKINISYAYQRPDAKWEFRVWGWLPCNGEVNDRDKFLGDLRDALRGKVSDSNGKTLWQFVFGKSDIQLREVEWHVLDCTKKDPIPYLKTLIGERGGAQ